MFSENQKISPRQLKRLLVLDFFGKGALLLPAFSQGLTAREFLLHLLPALGLLLLYAWALTRLSFQVRSSFPGYLKGCLGRKTAVLVELGFLAYAFWNLVYLTKVFGTLGCSFVLLEEREEWLLALLLLGALYMALGGLEVRGRTAEVWYPLLFYPMILLLFLSGHNAGELQGGAGAGTQTGGIWQAGGVGQAGGGLRISVILQMFSVFGGTAGFLFLAPRVHGRREGRKAFLQAVGVVAAALLGLFLVLAGNFGEQGISGFRFPAAELMSSAKIPGGFLERWDVIFTALLMGGLFVSAGASLYYGIYLGKCLFPRVNRRWFGGGFCLLAFLAAAGFETYENVVKLYISINSYVLVPLGTAVILLLLWLEKVKRRKK